MVESRELLRVMPPRKMSQTCCCGILYERLWNPLPSTRPSDIMIIQILHCPYCQGTDIVRHGNTRQGKQRYRCRECREGRGRTIPSGGSSSQLWRPST